MTDGIKKVLVVLASILLFVLTVDFVVRMASGGEHSFAMQTEKQENASTADAASDGEKEKGWEKWLEPAHIMHFIMLFILAFAVVAISIRLVSRESSSKKEHFEYQETVLTLLVAIVGGLFVLMAFRIDSQLTRFSERIDNQAAKAEEVAGKVAGKVAEKVVAKKVAEGVAKIAAAAAEAQAEVAKAKAAEATKKVATATAGIGVDEKTAVTKAEIAKAFPRSSGSIGVRTTVKATEIAEAKVAAEEATKEVAKATAEAAQAEAEVAKAKTEVKKAEADIGVAEEAEVRAAKAEEEKAKAKAEAAKAEAAKVVATKDNLCKDITLKEITDESLKKAIDEAIALGEKECFSQAISAYEKIQDQAPTTNTEIRLTAKLFSGIDHLNLENSKKANTIFKAVYDEAKEIKKPEVPVIWIAIRAGLTYAMMDNTSDTDTRKTLNEIINRYEKETDEEIKNAVNFVQELKELYSSDDEIDYDTEDNPSDE